MSRAASTDILHMEKAICLARRAWGMTHPNPMVGALIVEHDEIVAEGWHKCAGEPHAEAEALNALGRKPALEATLYVTLEPCSTTGRTGACTELILKSGIRRVVIGTVDPNPAHAGRGIQLMREGGIEVVEGVLRDECEDLNLIFNHWITNGSPLLAGKLAITLDGKFSASSGNSKWVTGDLSREDVMLWRRYFPSIAVGANTVLQDDPSLTSRVDGTVFCPRRFVFDSHLKTIRVEREFKLFSDEFKQNTVLLCLERAPRKLKAAALDRGLTVWELPEKDGHVDWTAFLKRCSDEALYGVYFEPGPNLATYLIETGKLNYCFIYKAAKFMSDSASHGIGSERHTRSMSEAIRLSDVRHKILGDDVLIRGWIAK